MVCVFAIEVQLEAGLHHHACVGMLLCFFCGSSLFYHCCFYSIELKHLLRLGIDYLSYMSCWLLKAQGGIKIRIGFRSERHRSAHKIVTGGHPRVSFDFLPFSYPKLNFFINLFSLFILLKLIKHSKMSLDFEKLKVKK